VWFDELPTWYQKLGLASEACWYHGGQLRVFCGAAALADAKGGFGPSLLSVAPEIIESALQAMSAQSPLY